MTGLVFKDSSALEVWLHSQGREVCVAFAARAALRALPLVSRAAGKRPGAASRLRLISLTAAAFRAAAFARIAAKYRTGADARADPTSGDAAYAAARNSADPAARAAGDAAAQAAHAAAYSYSYSNAAAAAVSAAEAAVAADVAAVAAAKAMASADAEFISVGGRGRQLVDRPLWEGKPPQLVASAWTSLQFALPKGQDWETWVAWYEDRLAGWGRNENYELPFTMVPREVWGIGAAEANAWIKAHLPKPPTVPLEHISGPFTFGWNSAAKIGIVSGPQNVPVFLFAAGEADHRQWLIACQTSVQRLIADVKARRFHNVRDDYLAVLERYADDLPIAPGVGNFVLADQEARIVRDLFAVEAHILPAPFAARLKAFLQFNIALRAFYPEVERLYDAVRNGHLEAPLPWDKVEEFGRAVVENTPRVFEPEVSAGLRDVERHPPIAKLAPEDVRSDSEIITPQPDPLGVLDPKKSRSFSVASTINGIMKVVSKGKAAGASIDGWENIGHKLGEIAQPVIDWLASFLN